jgi:preprotein translocase subunit SecF
MIEIFKNTNFDFLGKKWLFIGLSWLLIAAGVVSVCVRAFDGNPNTHPFNMGVDFSGGTIVTAKFGGPPDLNKLRAAVEKQGIPGSSIVLQAVGETIGQPLKNQVLIRIPDLTGGKFNTSDIATQNADEGKKKIQLALNEMGDKAAQIIGAEAVSPQIGADLRNRAVYVTLIACLAMLMYVAFRFKSWGFGIGAIIAVLHDVLITLGLFSIFQFEINLTVIAALLTLVGFSMNDTIVIFDRIRENLGINKREPLEKVSNDAINQTLSRTVITSGLTLLTVVAMVAFGGEVLKSFSWCLFIGIIIGTYSSIYIASPFMLWWEEKFGHRLGNSVVATATAATSTVSSVVSGGASAISSTANVLPVLSKKKAKRKREEA